MREFSFLRFRRVIQGKDEIPPELADDPELLGVLVEARAEHAQTAGGLSIVFMYQLFREFLPLILYLLNRKKT